MNAGVTTITVSNPKASFLIGGGERMDRTIPPVLRSYLNTEEWETFCDEYDKILVDKRNEKLRVVQCAMLLPILGIILLALGIVKQTQNFHEESNYNWGSNQWEDDDGNRSGIPLGIIFGPLILMGSCFAIVFCAARVHTVLMEDVRVFCETKSKQYGNSLYFHIRQEIRPTVNSHGHPSTATTYYLDIAPTDVEQRQQQGGGSALSTIAGQMTVPSSSSTPSAIPVTKAEAVVVATEPEIVVDNTNEVAFLPPATAPPQEQQLQSARQRLEQLDRMKDMLTQAEYNDKRQEILDSL